MRAARLLALALATGLSAVAGACSESTAPSGKGDTLIVDVDSSSSTGDNGGDNGGGGGDAMNDSPFGQADAPYAPIPDGYAPFDWCSTCGCPDGTFCFGGGSGITSFSGDCHVDAGPLTQGSQLAIGCYPYPPACANEPSCECLIMAVSQFMPCYPVCTITKNVVYCPNP